MTVVDQKMKTPQDDPDEIDVEEIETTARTITTTDPIVPMNQEVTINKLVDVEVLDAHVKCSLFTSMSLH